MRWFRPGLIWLAPIVFFVGLAMLWQWAALAIPTVLPPLDAVLADLAGRPGFYAANAAATLRAALVGFFFGALGGILAAIACAKSRVVEAAVVPLAITISVTPVVAIAPALIIAFGFTDTPRIIVAALSAFFPMFVSILSGLRRTDQAALEVFRALSASPWDRLVRLELPTCLPALFAGSRLAVTAAVIGTLVSEFTGTSRGLGAVIILATSYLDIVQMWAAIFVSIAISMLLLGAVSILEKLTIRW